MKLNLSTISKSRNKMLNTHMNVIEYFSFIIMSAFIFYQCIYFIQWLKGKISDRKKMSTFPGKNSD